MARKYKTKALLALAAASLGIGACTFPGAVASVPEREEEVAAVATAVDTIPDHSMPTAPGFPTAVPTPAYILPSLESLAVNGTALIAEDDVFTVPAEINPGDRLQVEAEVADDVDGTLSALSSSRPYRPEGGAVEFSLTVPADLSSADIPLVLEGSDGERAEYALRITPSSEWAPTVVVENPTGLTGEVSLEVRVTDLNGSDTVQSLTVEQEFNPQATGNKRIREYISNTSLAPFTIEQTESGLYVVRFNAEWPGRFPLHFTAVDADGNETDARVPIEVYWAEQPFEIRGIWTGWFAPGDPEFYDTYFDQLQADQVNLLQIQINGYMPSLSSGEFRDCDYEWSPDSPCSTGSPEALHRMIEEAHNRGLAVMLVPAHVIGDWEPTWQMNPDWSEWFSLEEGAPSYSNWLLTWARFAEENGVEHFSIGRELHRSHTQRQRWIDLITAVRGVYTGKINYGDNYWVFFNGEREGPFPACEYLDYYGLQFYYPASGGRVGGPARRDPTLEEMRANLSEQIQQQFLPALQSCGSVPFFISEAGLSNIDGGSQHPEALDTELVIDNQEQADYLTAMLEVMSEYPRFRGAVIMQYQPQPNAWSEMEGLAGDIRGLPVEQALRIFYTVGDGPE